MWLSHPQIGKHTAFDGRLLHGAPALYFPSRDHPSNQPPPPGTEEPRTKRQKVDDFGRNNKKRYTLLVNIWLNHWVMDAALLDEEICAQLKTPWEADGISTSSSSSSSSSSPFIWNPKVDLSQPAPAPQKITLSPSKIDPAGEDEITLCNHNVTVKYNPLMEECHRASRLASTVEIQLEPNAISLHVGDVLKVSEDEEEEEEGEVGEEEEQQ